MLRSFATAAAYRSYLARLRDVPRYFDEEIANMRAGLARGFTPPQVVQIMTLNGARILGLDFHHQLDLRRGGRRRRRGWRWHIGRGLIGTHHKRRDSKAQRRSNRCGACNRGKASAKQVVLHGLISLPILGVSWRAARSTSHVTGITRIVVRLG